MFESIKTFLKERLPVLGNLHEASARALNNVTDAYYAFRPFSSLDTRMTPYGFKLGGGNSVHHKAMQEGRFEPEEIAIIRHRLEDADVFVDVGANIGFYSCMALHAGKHVVAVEPQDGNLRHLYANLQANGWENAEIFPLGLGSIPGLAYLFGPSSTGASMIPGWAGASRRIRRTIPVTTLDILLGNRFHGKKLFIKIDVEGVEREVLKGAGSVLAISPKPTWMVEICLKEYYPGGMNPNYEETFRLFWENGYEARTAGNDYLIVTPEDIARHVRNGRSDSGVINYLFLPAQG